MNALYDILIVFGDHQPCLTRTYLTKWEIFYVEHPFFTVYVSHPADNPNPAFKIYHFQSGQRSVWFMGEIHPNSVGDISDISQALQPFIEDPMDSGIHVSRLNGHFLAMGWDRPHRHFHVWTNRFGTVHAYYSCNSHQAAIGTFFPAVAAVTAPHQLDWTGLTGFFALGFFLGDSAFFSNVRILRPASHYVFNANGRLLAQKRYWDWHYAPNTRKSFNDTVAEFGEVFHQVTDDLAPNGRVAVPISGGLDSRSTVAAITRARRSALEGLTPWSYSYGYSDDSVETRIARQVAVARQLPFKAYTIRPYLFERLPQILSLTEGFQDVTQCRQMFVRDEIAANADTLISALWGDVWLGDMGLADVKIPLDETELFAHVMKKFRKHGGEWLLENLCRPYLSDNPQELIEESIKAELRRFDSIDDPDFRIKALKMETWSFRWSLPPIRIFQSAAVPKLVFYDTRLADFFATVPSRYMKNRMLQIEYLRRFAPDLARITWQAYDANLYQYRYFNSWLLPKRAVKKAWRFLTGKRTLQRNWEVQFLCPEGRAGLQQWLVNPGLKLHELMPRSKVQLLVEDFFRDPWHEGRGYTVSMLLTFSAWLEMYG